MELKMEQTEIVNTEKPKVSIVMPTYNVEKYFRQCIESVINQTLKEIEIIPVDDGSPDNCGKIMDEYAAKDGRIKPIHKENGGYGSAVNVGIEKATGEYIAILETDDFVEPNAYELLYNEAKRNDTDMTKCKFYFYNSFRENKDEIKQNDKVFLYTNSPKGVFFVKEYPQILYKHASVWAAVYKSSFIKELKFIEKGYYQDFPFFIETVCKAKRISIVRKYLIHYRLEEGQNSSTMRNDEKLLKMAENCIIGKDILKKYGFYEGLPKEAFYKHAFNANYGFYNRIPLKYKYKYNKLLKELFKDIKNDKSFKYLYFQNDQKEFVENILKKPTFISLFGLCFKAFKKAIINSYDYMDIYRVTKIFGFIKITTKPSRLQINLLKKRLDYLQMLNEKMHKELKNINSILKNHKD